MLQGEVTCVEVNTVVDIKIDVYIKDNYIEDEMQKLEIYKKYRVLRIKRIFHI